MNGRGIEGKKMSQTVFAVGDLVWTKVGKHPFWPCMVSYDPLDGNFTKVVTVRGKEQTMYHVQYFGKAAQRGWITAGDSFEFKGKKDYFDKANAILDKSAPTIGSKALKKLKARYDIPASSKTNWLIAVEEASGALLVEDTKERFEDFVFSYDKLKLKSPVLNGEKVKRKSSLLNGPADQYNESNETFNESVPKRIRQVIAPQFCDLCNKDDAELQCTGTCDKFFHKGCVDLANVPDNFKCANCSEDLYSCFACQKSNGVLEECAHSKCTKYYHAECLDQYECANINKNICPLHTCVTCYRENPRNIMSNKGNMLQCIKCPTAFHARESCFAAGSVMKTSSTIICPYHFVGKSRKSHLKTCNMNYCTECDMGGELVCCEGCPNAFHRYCLKTAVPKDDFLCEDCTSKRFLLYDMIVWGKIGKYRWWPAKIKYSSCLPLNVKKLKHRDGEFAVQFYGTYDYAWIHSGRAFPYLEMHKDIKASKNTKFYEQFKTALAEASVAFDEYKKKRQSESLLDKKPEAFKLIQVNRALPPAQILVDLAHISTCTCDPTKENPCGPDSDCLNRSMLMECHPDYCLANNLCQNQKFQKRQYVSTKILKTNDRGWGLQTLQHVKKGEFIIEYVGEIITHEEYRLRSGEMLANGNSNYYFLYLDAKRMIDAGPMGNYSRFINHSCDPNCEMRKWSVNGDARIGIFALMDIPEGKELTFNYQSDKYEFEQTCHCSSEHCRGFIGRKTNNPLKSTGASNKVDTSKKFAITCKFTGRLVNFKENGDRMTPKPKKRSKSKTSRTPASLPTTKYSSGLKHKKHSKSKRSSTSASLSKTNNVSAANNSSTMSSEKHLESSSSSVSASFPATNNSSINDISLDTSTTPLAHVSVISPALRKRLALLNPKCLKCKSVSGERLILCSRTTCYKTYHKSCIGLGDEVPVSEKEQPLSCMTHMYTNTNKSDTKLKRILQPAIQIWNIKRRKKK